MPWCYLLKLPEVYLFALLAAFRMSSLFTDIEGKLAPVTGVDFRIFVAIRILSWLPSLLRSKFIPRWLCWLMVLGVSFVEAVAKGVEDGGSARWKCFGCLSS